MLSSSFEFYCAGRKLLGAPHCFWGSQWEQEVFSHIIEWFNRYL